MIVTVTVNPARRYFNGLCDVLFVDYIEVAKHIVALQCRTAVDTPLDFFAERAEFRLSPPTRRTAWRSLHRSVHTMRLSRSRAP